MAAAAAPQRTSPGRGGSSTWPALAGRQLRRLTKGAAAVRRGQRAGCHGFHNVVHLGLRAVAGPGCTGAEHVQGAAQASAGMPCTFAGWRAWERQNGVGGTAGGWVRPGIGRSLLDKNSSRSRLASSSSHPHTGQRAQRPSSGRSTHKQRLWHPQAAAAGTAPTSSAHKQCAQHPPAPRSRLPPAPWPCAAQRRRPRGPPPRAAASAATPGAPPCLLQRRAWVQTSGGVRPGQTCRPVVAKKVGRGFRPLPLAGLLSAPPSPGPFLPGWLLSSCAQASPTAPGVAVRLTKRP